MSVFAPTKRKILTVSAIVLLAVTGLLVHTLLIGTGNCLVVDTFGKGIASYCDYLSGDFIVPLWIGAILISLIGGLYLTIVGLLLFYKKLRN